MTTPAHSTSQEHSSSNPVTPFLPVVSVKSANERWIKFLPHEEPMLVRPQEWIGFDLDGTLSRTDNPGHFEPPYPIGDPIPDVMAVAKSLVAAGVRIKIFTARACGSEHVPAVRAWAEKHGLGGIDVTNQKDFELVRFYDDRAIQVAKPAVQKYSGF